jgi:nicotinamide-nucleotide adenylyltransferase
MKKYRLGMYLGRFQPFHNGHKAIVDKMLEECEQVLIVVGSSQEKGTIKNPFPAWERMMMIDACYPETPVACIAIPDRLTLANDCSWGEYVMNFIGDYGYFPDAIYEGFEAERCTWWNSFPSVEVVCVSRLSLPISATIVRAAIVEQREDFIRELCPPPVADYIIKSICWGRKFHE